MFSDVYIKCFLRQILTKNPIYLIFILIIIFSANKKHYKYFLANNIFSWFFLYTLKINYLLHFVCIYCSEEILYLRHKLVMKSKSDILGLNIDPIVCLIFGHISCDCVPIVCQRDCVTVLCVFLKYPKRCFELHLITIW